MNDLIRARRAIDTLAVREGVPSDRIRMSIQEAIQEAQKDTTPKTELLWRTMTPDGNPPSPEQLIIWIVNTIESKC